MTEIISKDLEAKIGMHRKQSILSCLDFQKEIVIN